MHEWMNELMHKRMNEWIHRDIYYAKYYGKGGGEWPDGKKY